ncbi:MAG: TetR/AcrR family transcriptional regulator [Flavobacteriales bacterium]|nr:TetR/AcrR family transcriptional regulator [Flavobacteriales bacterium]
MALTKTEIIKRSIPVFKEKGYNATCMADIANATGILKGSIYHHFPSKEALMTEILEYLRSYFVEKVFSIAYNEKSPIEKRLEKLARKSEEHFLDGTGGCFMSMIGTETVLNQKSFNLIITEFFKDWHSAFMHLYSQVTDAQKADQYSERAIMLIEGAVLLMRIHNNVDYLTKVQKMLLSEFKLLNINHIKKSTIQ